MEHRLRGGRGSAAERRPGCAEFVLAAPDLVSARAVEQNRAMTLLSRDQIEAALAALD